MNIAVISDTHLTPPELESKTLFPRQLDKLSEKDAAALYKKLRDEMMLAYRTACKWLRQQNPCFIVHCGDVTGGWQERGCFHHSSQFLARACKNELQGIATQEVLFCVGNHDTGYSHKGSLPGSGIYYDSIEACEQIFGPLFWAKKKEGILMLGVSSSLAEYTGDDSRIINKVRAQLEFVGDTLSKWGGPWIFFSHSPFTPKWFAREIGSRIHNLRAVVCGDWHDPRHGKLARWMAKGFQYFNKGELGVMFKCWTRLIPVPSVAPLWWTGYSLLNLNWHDGILTATQVALEHPEESFKDIPTSSKFRGLWWMIRPR